MNPFKHKNKEEQKDLKTITEAVVNREPTPEEKRELEKNLMYHRIAKNAEGIIAIRMYIRARKRKWRL